MKKEKSESQKMQDELEPIWHSTEHDESDDIEKAKEITEEKKKEKEKQEKEGKKKDNPIKRGLDKLKELI